MTPNLTYFRDFFLSYRCFFLQLPDHCWSDVILYPWWLSSRTCTKCVRYSWWSIVIYLEWCHPIFRHLTYWCELEDLTSKDLLVVTVMWTSAPLFYLTTYCKQLEYQPLLTAIILAFGGLNFRLWDYFQLVGLCIGHAYAWRSHTVIPILTIWLKLKSEVVDTRAVGSMLRQENQTHTCYKGSHQFKIMWGQGMWVW